MREPADGPGTPVPQTAEDLAKRLSDLLGDREIITPPADLVRALADGIRGFATSERADVEERHLKAAAVPFWNETVAVLGGRGIRGLPRLNDYVEGLRAGADGLQLKQTVSAGSREAAYARVETLSLGVLKFGDDASLADSLGDDPDRSFWSAVSSDRGSDYMGWELEHTSEIGGYPSGPPSMVYALMWWPSRTVPHLTPIGAWYDSDLTWGRVLEMETESLDHRERAEEVARVRRLLNRYRLRIAEKVAREVLVVGHVSPLTVEQALGRPAEKKRPEDHSYKEHLFALAALPVVEARPDTMCTGIFKIVADILEELQHEHPLLLKGMGVSPDSVEQRAKATGAFTVLHRGSGRIQDMEGPRRRTLEIVVRDYVTRLEESDALEPKYAVLKKRVVEIATERLKRE